MEVAPAFTPQRGVAVGRSRLAQLHANMHCSVLGTCLSTAELARVIGHYVDVDGWTDFDVHHHAVALTHKGGQVAKALHKALDQRHDQAINRFSGARDVEAPTALWKDALRHGDIPGAYWALLTHRAVTPELRQKAFGNVQMLSHLVGAANRADLGRLDTLARTAAELTERLARQQLRSQQLLDERDATIARLRKEVSQAQASVHSESIVSTEVALEMHWRTAEAAQNLAVQIERRKRAERNAIAAENEAVRLQAELSFQERHVVTLNQELAAAEIQLREINGSIDSYDTIKPLSLAAKLHGRRVLYVGGRPSSTPAIRDLVMRNGGDFRRHDGGLEDRKGMLASAVAGSDLVVFPVDCIDHDSAATLKRTCLRNHILFVPMRSASVACFAAAIMSQVGEKTIAPTSAVAQLPKHDASLLCRPADAEMRLAG